jgi:hypothetical protein
MTSEFEGACRRLQDAIVSEVHNRLLVGWRRVDRPEQVVAVVQQVLREVLAADVFRPSLLSACAPRALCLVSLEGGGLRLRAGVRPTQRVGDPAGRGCRVVPLRRT